MDREQAEAIIKEQAAPARESSYNKPIRQEINSAERSAIHAAFQERGRSLSEGLSKVVTLAGADRSIREEANRSPEDRAMRLGFDDATRALDALQNGQYKPDSLYAKDVAFRARMTNALEARIGETKPEAPGYKNGRRVLDVKVGRKGVSA